MKCMICEKSVSHLDEKWGANMESATEIAVSPGYGSRFDTLSFRGFICDDCLKELSDKDRIEAGFYSQNTTFKWENKCLGKDLCDCPKCLPMV